VAQKKKKKTKKKPSEQCIAIYLHCFLIQGQCNELGLSLSCAGWFRIGAELFGFHVEDPALVKPQSVPVGTRNSDALTREQNTLCFDVVKIHSRTCISWVEWHVFHGLNGSVEVSGEKCMICLAHFESGNVVSFLDCRHYFHRTCIRYGIFGFFLTSMICNISALQVHLFCHG